MNLIFNIKNTHILLLIVTLVCATACKKDPEPPTPGTVNLTSTSAVFEESRGNTVDIPVTVRAEDGIKSLTVAIDRGTAESLSVTAGTTETNVTYSFNIPANSVLNTPYVLTFTLTDSRDQTSVLEITVNTKAVIEVPTTYEFTREGNSTVSRSGQTERLNMVEEIKANILSAGDKGNIISEQALLDAYSNTGGNGGGLFSFESSKQLKNKTFQPDLDAQLFENLFASAATASVAGNAGTVAANGTAGLITREDKGSTILVDEHGREFTQLIEKGLMGAVFYNQIYNVYLSDGRTGDDVENVALSEGKNYTPMEHHWDEAFGYWDPPLDFTSPWPEARASEDRFWSHYSNVVDNVKNGDLGTNKIIMDAFIAGRAAVVNQDLDTKNAKRTELIENLDLVAAAVAVHYINLSLRFFNEGKTGETFHVLSEAWAFTNALRYNPNRKLSLAELHEIMETDFGANGNFWNVTADGLNKAKATIANAYPRLDPIQDDL